MRVSDLRLLEVHTTESGESLWREIPPRRCAVRRGIAIAAAILLLAVGVLVGMPTRYRPQPVFVHVTVAPGDTLWSLARRHSSAHQYLPEAIHEIRRANHLESAQLSPGQALLIPVQAPTRIRWQAEAALARADTH